MNDFKIIFMLMDMGEPTLQMVEYISSCIQQTMKLLKQKFMV